MRSASATAWCLVCLLGALPDNEVTEMRSWCKTEVCSSGWQQHAGCNLLHRRIRLLSNILAAM